MDKTIKQTDISQTQQTSTLHMAKSYLCKMKGGKCPALPKISFTGLLVTSLGSFAGIGLVTLLATYYNLPLLLPPFGATAVLLYGACHVPMAQPRNVIGGHLISAFAGVTTYQFFGNFWWSITLGVTISIIIMTITHTLHPPGGATAFVAVYTGQNYSFIFSPVGIGIICLVLIAVIINNISSQRKYPDYWY